MILVLCAGSALGQQTRGTLKGQVFDELGGAIVGATITAVDANGVEKTTTTNGEGLYTISGLAPGKYTVRASNTGFSVYENKEFDIPAGTKQLSITLNVTIQEQKVTVSGDNQSLSTEPENNAGALVLKGSDIDALPDDPDDLASALQALAGPSAGPNGGQIFIDGFTGGRLPPKSSIREIRINSNPFSAEYDRLGMGRIEILTKPGTDSFRGQGFFSFNDNALNSRNPYAPERPPYQARQFGGNFSGPISSKKASFFFDFEKRDIDDQALVVATILDPSLNIIPFSGSFATPIRRTTFSPRFDYQLNASNTLVGRYSYEHFRRLIGVGGFSLNSRAYDTRNTEQTVQLTETALINKKIVNETRFQFVHQIDSQNADNSIPTINVQEAFVGGGSQVGLSSNTENRWELQNNTSVVLGSHALKFGARMRGVRISDISPQNFGGTWTFSGGSSGLTSIERYQLTQRLLQQGVSPNQIRSQGGGATQFSIATGDPKAEVSQFDFGGFAQDDWKVRPNFTLNLGLRYENQSNISSNLNFAPRVGFAWALGATGQQQPKTVIRGGVGIFYDRIAENLTLQEERFNGINQRQFIVTDPLVLDLFPVVPSISTLTSFATPVSIYQLAKDIQAPYTIQSVISVERSLPRNFTLTLSYVNARTLHLLRARPINAPLPGTFIPGVPNSGIRPLGSSDNIFEYESTGRFNQNQLIVGLTNTLGRRGSIRAFYVFAKANSDTDGSGTFPASPYDFTGEYGRSSVDVRHRFVLIGTLRAPWGFNVNPMLIVTSGTPFNITVGRDLNGDTIFNDRPAFATDLTKPGVVITPWGAFDPNPTPGETIIPRNLGSGPGSITTRLGISKTFGFGPERSAVATRQGNRGEGGEGGGGPRGPLGMGRGPGGGGGGRGGFGGGGGRGGFGGGGGGETGKRYNLTFSLNVQNILNHTNKGRPVGNLSSQFFGLATSSGGNFGNFGGGGGGGACQGACNRRVEAQIRFSF